jgi:hypothetical protein
MVTVQVVVVLVVVVVCHVWSIRPCSEIQSILDVDVTETIGGINDDRDIAFQYSSTLPQLLYSYGEIGLGDETWLHLTLPPRPSSPSTSPASPLSFLTPTKSSPTATSVEQVSVTPSAIAPRTSLEMEYEQRRSTLCSLVDQVEAIVTQTNSMSRHIEIIMKGIGYQPSHDQRQQRIGELRRSLSAPISHPHASPSYFL